MLTKNREAYQASFSDAADAIVTICNTVLLRGKTPVKVEQLLKGDLGGKESFLHAIVLPTLQNPDANEEALLLVQMSANMAIWQAIMRGILPRALIQEVIKGARTGGQWKDTPKRLDVRQQVVADAFAVKIGSELYVHPHNRTHRYVPNQPLRHQRMLYALEAIAQLAVRMPTQPPYWICVRLIAELKSWEVKSEVLLNALGGQAVQKSHVRTVQQLVHFARLDTCEGGTDAELSLIEYTASAESEPQTATHLIPPARRKVALH